MGGNQPFHGFCNSPVFSVFYEALMDNKKTYTYLIQLQYLGFRYHGWQKQPEVKTIESMLEKTFQFVLGHDGFKMMGTSRTDSKVSANHSAFMLYISQEQEPDALMEALNVNLPPDIRILSIARSPDGFNIRNSPKMKEYLYLFSFGAKAHPFAAPLMANFQPMLDIDLMEKGAPLFEGEHDFVQYCTKPGADTRLKRTIHVCRIETNQDFQASFFPKKSYLMRVQAMGFLRYQIRLIMGQLLELGEKKITLADIRRSLTGMDRAPLKRIAPASGLILNKINFQTPG